MATLAAQVKNADRMMTFASATNAGIEVAFADGRKGLIPFADIPEVRGVADLTELELPNPYQIVLRNSRGETVEIPWDFARHYCDAFYRPRVEALATLGRKALGARLRALREATGTTQEALAAAAGISRVTLVRIENGEQSPKLATLVSLARALGCPLPELVAGPEVG